MVNLPSTVDKRTDPDGARKERNRLNRKRGKKMETEISILFLGNTRGKVAASGAGSDKGDVKVPLPNNSGNCYVECKTSALRHEKLGAGIPLRFEWFDIIERNRIAMGHRMGILAIHFHQYSGNYIFFRTQDIPLIESISGNTYHFGGMVIDGRYSKAGKKRITDTFHRGIMLEGFKQSTGSFPNIRYETHSGQYVVVSVEDFKEILGYS